MSDAKAPLCAEALLHIVLPARDRESVAGDLLEEYREEVLPADVKARIAVEQGSVLGWDRYVGADGRVIGMKTFGASAPLKELQHKFGFEPEHIVEAAMELLGRR